MSTSPPAGRYSRNASRAPAAEETRGSRRRTVALSVAGALFGLAVAYLGYTNLADKPVSAELTGFSLAGPTTIDVRIDVTRSDPARAVVCIVRARSLDGSETGRREVYVPPSDQRLFSVDSSVSTSQPPVAADVYGCGTDVPSYLVPA